MLVWFVVIYLALSIALGLAASMRVKSSGDYITAGRHLPIYVVFAMVFATWFGAETVLGISGTFLDEGFAGLISDPLGASLCLVLFGLFFARPLYRQKLLTIGDFYRRRYSRGVELVTSICIALSYLGWVSAQVVALGLVFDVLTEGAVTREQGMVIGAAIVILYTLFGGMWSVAVTTFVQMIVIVGGLLWIGVLASEQAGGVSYVVQHAADAGKFRWLPEFNTVELLAFIAALLTMGFGSIPQQDVFQRANSAKSENIAVWGTVLGGIAYFLFAAVPLFLAYAGTLVDPTLVTRVTEQDSQLVLPALVYYHLPLYAQIIFYGALLSVIMSTASGTLLAPSVTIAENVLRGALPAAMSDRQFLWLTRGIVLLFGIGVTLYSLSSEVTIHHMVEEAYKVTLVAAFVPLLAGLYWKRATTQGAALAITFGIGTWLMCEFFAADAALPPQLAGLLASFMGMAIGSLLPQWYRGTETSAAAA